MSHPCRECGQATDLEDSLCLACYQTWLAQKMTEIADSIQPAGLASKGDPTDPVIVESE